MKLCLIIHWLKSSQSGAGQFSVHFSDRVGIHDQAEVEINILRFKKKKEKRIIKTVLVSRNV